MTPEGRVQAYLVKRIQALGGETRKVGWIGRRGAPDILVLLPGSHPFVEVKRLGQKPEPHQLLEHERLRKAGFTVLVIDTLAGVDQAFPLLEDVCPGCGDGDKVPAEGYWHCPVCDAEWGVEDEELL